MMFAKKMLAVMRKLMKGKVLLSEVRSVSLNPITQNQHALYAQRGDLIAQEQLLKSMRGYIRTVCMRYALDKDLLEDLQQECVIAILESLPYYKFPYSACTFFRYKMMTACRNYMARNAFAVKIPPITYRRKNEGKISGKTQHRIDMFCDVIS